MRHLTTGVVLVLSLVGAARGWNAMEFAAARASAAIDAVRTGTGLPGFNGDVPAPPLTKVQDPEFLAAARQRTADIGALLSVRPLSAVDWLALAQLRLATGAPANAVNAALAMSWLTGPNEGYLMLQRGLLGALEWNLLTHDARQRTIADLAGVTLSRTLGDGDFARARKVLADISVAMRQEIAKRVAAEGVPRDQLVRLGL